MSDFSVSATVGQASTHAPHDTHSDSRNGSFWLAATFDAKPRPCDRQRERALHLVARAHAARADDAQRRVECEVRVAGVLARRRRGSAPFEAVARLGDAETLGHVLQLAVAVGRAADAVERMIGDVQLHDVATELVRASALSVRTFMPSATGVVHDAG